VKFVSSKALVIINIEKITKKRQLPMISDLSLCQTSLNLWQILLLSLSFGCADFWSFPNGLHFNPTEKFNIWEAIKCSFNSLCSVYIK